MNWISGMTSTSQPNRDTRAKSGSWLVKSFELVSLGQHSDMYWAVKLGGSPWCENPVTSLLMRTKYLSAIYDLSFGRDSYWKFNECIAPGMTPHLQYNIYAVGSQDVIPSSYSISPKWLPIRCVNKCLCTRYPFRLSMGSKPQLSVPQIPSRAAQYDDF